MIGRIWQGTTLQTKSAEYLEYIMKTGIRDYLATEGNQGVYILRRVQGEYVEFFLISFWESLDAIRKFAGENIQKAVYYPRDQEYLLELEPEVTHYEVMAAHSIIDPRLGPRKRVLLDAM